MGAGLGTIWKRGADGKIIPYAGYYGTGQINSQYSVRRTRIPTDGTSFYKNGSPNSVYVTANAPVRYSCEVILFYQNPFKYHFAVYDWGKLPEYGTPDFVKPNDPNILGGYNWMFLDPDNPTTSTPFSGLHGTISFFLIVILIMHLTHILCM